MKKIFLTTIAILISFSFVSAVFASTTDGTIDTTNKYAWSENSGWIDFGASHGAVHVTDSALTGYAWGENIGWISLNCSNDSTCDSAVNYKVANNGEGTLSGYAWSENAGWINFAPVHGGVTINSSGEFSGYAWGENVGWIVFNCATTSSCSDVNYKVATDWRPASSRVSSTPTPTPAPAGGGSCVGCWVPPVVPNGGFKMSINGGASMTSNRNVFLGFNAGADIKKIAISMTGDFTDAAQEEYQPSRQWDLCSKFGGLVKNPTCSDGTYTVYARFYTAYGRTSDTASSSSTVILKSENSGATTPENLQQIVNQPTYGSFTKNLSYKQTDADVKRLQIFFNSDFDTRLANTGVGSSGKETNFFGLLTKSAVIRFQEKYAQDILSPWGLVKGTGFVGKTTLAKLNELIRK